MGGCLSGWPRAPASSLLLSPSAFPYPSFLPAPGFLHTPDGSHLAPTLSRHSPPVFSAPGAGRRGGPAHPPGAHSHCAGKAATASSRSSSPLTPPLLLTLLLLSFGFDLPLPFLPHLAQGLFSCRASNVFIFPDFQLLAPPPPPHGSFLSGTVVALKLN